MMQIQAHQAYFQSDGRLIFSNTFVKPPKNKKVTILWEEEIIPDKKPTSQQQTVLDVLQSLESISKDFTPEDLESFERLERGDFKLKFEERLP